MDDDYKVTLKGKIKILFQLGKWQDVVKLTEQYTEKYGKDMEIDMMRFKSDRQLGKKQALEETSGPNALPQKEIKKSQEIGQIRQDAEEEVPLLLVEDQAVARNPAVLIIEESPDAQLQVPMDEAGLDEPFTNENELLITDAIIQEEAPFPSIRKQQLDVAVEQIPADPFAPEEALFPQSGKKTFGAAGKQLPVEPVADEEPLLVPANAGSEAYRDENELIIIEPFAGNEPGFSLAADDVPVTMIDVSAEEPTEEKDQVHSALHLDVVENALVQDEAGAELEIMKDDFPSDARAKNVFDLSDRSSVASPPAEPPSPSPRAEPMVILPEVQENLVAPETIVPTAPETMAPVAPAQENFAHELELTAAAMAEEKIVEKPFAEHKPFKETKERPAPAKKAALNLKLVLLLLLPLAAAVVLWLALSGKLNLSGGAVENVAPTPEAKPPVREVVRRPVRKTPVPVQQPQGKEKEDAVSEKIVQAGELLKKGETLKAWAVVLEAKKIMMTEPLRQLEALLAQKIRDEEALAKKQVQTVQSLEQLESQAFDKATAENTLAAWKTFLQKYPQGAFAAQAQRKVVALEKTAAQNAEQQLRVRIQQAQKMTLRSAYANLNQVELSASLNKLGRLPVQFEPYQRGSEKVIIDFTSGLMWTLWNKPMAFDKAKWWSNRIYAGYSGWRLPTIEEALSLLQIDNSLYAGLADFLVWTGDQVSDQARTIWVLDVANSRFVPVGYAQSCYVWAVRQAGR